VKERVGEEIPVVPVHSTPSVETLDQLLTVPPGAKILIVGHNKRSVARLSGLVRDYTEDAKLIGITLDDREKMPKLVADADVVFAVRVAAEALAKMQGVKRLIPVRFVLEGSLRQKLIAAENQRVA
jgi:hypothetical protein